MNWYVTALVLSAIAGTMAFVIIFCVLVISAKERWYHCEGCGCYYTQDGSRTFLKDEIQDVESGFCGVCLEVGKWQ